ncbi:MAG: mannosyltransferase family protein [Solirubrobacteraceae bacterium]
METVPERLEPRREPLELRSVDAPVTEPATLDEPIVRRAGRRPSRPHRRRRWSGRLNITSRDVLYVLAIYFATRVLLLVAAYVEASIGHHDFLRELSNWDGLWYREVANHGYLSHPSYAQTTLGFFPLFPICIWLLEPIFQIFGHDQIWAASVSGAVISGIGGAVACVYVFRLAEAWWDREVALRAAVLFILFPGSVVFSMVYSEGLMLPLAAACLYALQRKRWLRAGILAGVATAVQPVALALIPVCAISALVELHRQGYRFRVLRRVAVAPLLSGVGIGAFAIFLWLWTGTPLATYNAQHHGWSEKTDPLALVHLTTTLAKQISFTHFNEPTINLNLVVGLIGAVLLGVMLIMVGLQWRRISIEAMIWTAGISFLALTSEYVPPNPRMLITAFPALMVAARYARGRWWTVLVWSNAILLVGLSMLTFVGLTLRP